jgi:predicted ATP-grasp superfamily ATP-dependent carboligase
VSLNTERRLLALGGETNALSVVRSLGRQGICVHASSALKCVAGFSRFATSPHYLYSPADIESRWKELLVDKPDPLLKGAVILALNDAAISFISNNEAELRKHYLLEQNDPQVREKIDNRVRDDKNLFLAVAL